MLLVGFGGVSGGPLALAGDISQLLECLRGLLDGSCERGFFWMSSASLGAFGTIGEPLGTVVGIIQKQDLSFKLEVFVSAGARLWGSRNLFKGGRMRLGGSLGGSCGCIGVPPGSPGVSLGFV